MNLTKVSEIEIVSSIELGVEMACSISATIEKIIKSANCWSKILVTVVDFTSLKEPPLTPELEDRINIIADLIVDRILEDKKRGVLKFKNVGTILNIR